MLTSTVATATSSWSSCRPAAAGHPPGCVCSGGGASRPGTLGTLYEIIENDPEYKKSLEANDRTAVNRAIRNVIWANNEDYGDIMNNESTFPQIDKDGSWIQTTFDDHSHIWSDSPNDFNEARPRRRFAEADTTDNDELPTDHLAQY